MPKLRSVDAKLERLREMRDEQASPDIERELQRYLQDASNHVVAAASEIAARNHSHELIPDMLAAFQRMMIDPVIRDKTCTAKTAIVKALHGLDCQDPEVLLIGARHVQEEPAWGGPVDTAAGLRAECAVGLVQIGFSGRLPVLVDLLADPERGVRIAAAQALTADGSAAALMLLRLKARLGDAESEVTGECLSGLMSSDPARSLPFVKEFLEGDPLVVEFALLALGNSRRSEAFEALKAFLETQRRGELRETALIAMALLRLPSATDFLLSLVGDANESTARGALSALAVLNYDPQVMKRVESAVKSLKRKPLEEFYLTKFHGN